ncbi:hypothetical protein VPNG_05280 [Cytospora leucostoma]|uniref:Uncharacterized protein n=1 Tax=Cytospora leucostoma TaxID=1230097 RepID=A0A423X889_9PEZI|nr:hypothetical protein VPNG_05280 [Cytospora leucostoma]
MATDTTTSANGHIDEIKNEADGQKYPLDIAVIGGGIIGVMVALGLLHRGFHVTVYERAAALPEIGAAFAFTGVARECMVRLNPIVLAALSRVGEANKNPMNRYWDGFNPKTKEQAENEEESLLFRLSARDLDYWGCLRSSLLCQMVDELPTGIVQFSKQLESYVDVEANDKVLLRFVDGTTAEADAVIGCDGIHSRTRQLLLGEGIPAAKTHYSHKVVYRALLPIKDAVSALGEDKANNQCTHLGPNAHIVSFPVANWTLLNVFVFLHDPEEWPDRNRMVTPGTREDVENAVRDWSPGVRELVSMFPENITRWGIYDTAEHPAPTYAIGRVCLAGDSGHATTPFHGAGACMGVEDALVLATALETAVAYPEYRKRKAKTISAALQAYSDMRLERSHWLVDSSRVMGDIYEWR